MTIAFVQLAMIFSFAAFAAVPNLTDAQRRQLATARDDGPLLDEPALYPLLNNVIAWQDELRSDSTNPDYDAIGNQPAAHRGARFLITGRFAGKPKHRADLKMPSLSRPGPWDDRIEQWAVVVRPDPEEVVILLLLDPPPRPRPGAHVDAVARFFKIWRTEDLRGDQRRFLVFAGKEAGVVSEPTGGAHRSLVVMLSIVLLLAVGWWWRRGSAAGRVRDGADHRARWTAESEDPSLPKDPAEALSKLANRNKD